MVMKAPVEQPPPSPEAQPTDNEIDSLLPSDVSVEGIRLVYDQAGPNNECIELDW